MLARNPVLAALAQARARAAPLFAKWCELNRAPFCPARPVDIARFVSDCASLGIERLWQAVQEISTIHISLGLADPTLGPPVAVAVGDVASIDPPRSWPDEHKRRFKSLPYDIQVFISSNEMRRERALRRAQNDAAAAHRDLVACKAVQSKIFKENTSETNECSNARAEDHAAAR